MNFSQGFTGIETSKPSNINNLIAFCSLNAGSAAAGTLANSSVYNNPTGGSFAVSPISISAVQVVTTNPLFVNDQIIRVNMMNSTTKMIDSNYPTPYNQKIYVYGNSQNKMDFQTAITLDFGGLSYDLVQLSLFQNSIIDPATSQLIKVFDFGAGPYTGAGTLSLGFNVSSGLYEIGIRIESTVNVSSIFYIQLEVLDPNLYLTDDEDEEGDDDDDDEPPMKAKKKKAPADSTSRDSTYYPAQMPRDSTFQTSPNTHSGQSGKR